MNTRAKNRSAEIERLQERIAELVIENDTIQAQLTNSNFNSNDVISYLKKAVEEKDGEIARLEDSLERLRIEGKNSIKVEIDRHKSVEECLRNEIEMIKAENDIMNTQLGNQHRMQMEMGEMVEKMNGMRRKLDEKEAELKRREADESTLSCIAEKKVRAELNEQFEEKIKMLRNEYNLQKEGELLMNQRMIERLEYDIAMRDAEIKQNQNTIEDLKSQLIDAGKQKENVDEENNKLRRLLEKSNILTEKALKDTKRRLEESEKKRTATLTQYNDIVATLKKEKEQLLKSKEQADIRVDEVESILIKEQNLREYTVRAHQLQNERLIELKSFLSLTFESPDARNDCILADNANALFARLAVIVGQIPIVK